jgi:hypothetical protein
VFAFGLCVILVGARLFCAYRYVMRDALSCGVDTFEARDRCPIMTTMIIMVVFLAFFLFWCVIAWVLGCGVVLDRVYM